MEKSEREILRALLIDATIALRSCYEVIERKVNIQCGKPLKDEYHKYLKKNMNISFQLLSKLGRKN